MVVTRDRVVWWIKVKLFRFGIWVIPVAKYVLGLYLNQVFSDLAIAMVKIDRKFSMIYQKK